jgi:Na+/proline symporter
MMRICLVAFSFVVLNYALASDLTIFQMVESAYKVTLAGAFTPLIFGIFWKKANHHGALASICFGIATWIFFEIVFGESGLIPAQLIGLFVSILSMVVVSLMTQQSTLAATAKKT